MGGRAVIIELTEAEQCDLMSWSSRRNTAQGSAVRTGPGLVCAEGEQNKRVAVALDVGVDTVGNCDGLPGTGLKGCRMSRNRTRRERSVMPGLRP